MMNTARADAMIIQKFPPVSAAFSMASTMVGIKPIIFILLDYESISEGWPHLVPQKYRPFVINVMNDVKDGMNRYFRGQAFVALCVGILFSIGFLIIDFPLASTMVGIKPIICK